MIRQAVRAGTLAWLLAGCATLGGNVKGAFACRAPDGSCAPTTLIDARAVATEASPPSPTQRPGHGRSGLVPSPARTPERTVTIHFPAFVDASGVLHEDATAHAVVEGPGWATATTPPTSEISRSPAPSSLREAVAGASAPAAEGLEPLPTQAPHPISSGVDVPTQAALDAARAGHRIGRSAASKARTTSGTDHSLPKQRLLQSPVEPAGPAVGRDPAILDHAQEKSDLEEILGSAPNAEGDA